MNNCKNDSSYMVYENDDCKIYYNLWSETGDLSFIFENKTDKDIYIKMSNSYFMKNNFVYDYYNNAIITRKNSFKVGSIYYDYFSSESSIFLESSSEKSVPEKEFIHIPAKLKKVIPSFYLNSRFLYTNDDINFNVPFHKSYNVDFKEEISPLKFRNSILYTFDPKNGAINYINNDFFVSSIYNIDVIDPEIFAPNKFYYIYNWKTLKTIY